MEKNLQDLILGKVKAAKIAANILEDPNTSAIQKAEAIRGVLGNDPKFWLVVVGIVYPSASSTPTQVVSAMPLSSGSRLLPSEALIYFLSKFLSGKRIDIPKTRELTKRVFGPGAPPVVWDPEKWKIFISAMKKASRCNFCFLDKDLNPEDIFRMVNPINLVNGYIFGENEGILPLLLAEIDNGDGQTKPLSVWLRSAICFDAVAALEVFDEQEIVQIRKLFFVIKANGGEAWLVAKARTAINQLRVANYTMGQKLAEAIAHPVTQ